MERLIDVWGSVDPQRFGAGLPAGDELHVGPFPRKDRLAHVIAGNWFERRGQQIRALRKQLVENGEDRLAAEQQGDPPRSLRVVSAKPVSAARVARTNSRRLRAQADPCAGRGQRAVRLRREDRRRIAGGLRTPIRLSIAPFTGEFWRELPGGRKLGGERLRLWDGDSRGLDA